MALRSGSDPERRAVPARWPPSVAHHLRGVRRRRQDHRLRRRPCRDRENPDAPRAQRCFRRRPAFATVSRTALGQLVWLMHANHATNTRSCDVNEVARLHGKDCCYNPFAFPPIYGPTPVCQTFDHRCERKSLLSYIRPVDGSFLLPGPDGYLRSSSSSSLRPGYGPCRKQVLNEPV